MILKGQLNEKLSFISFTTFTSSQEFCLLPETVQAPINSRSWRLRTVSIFFPSYYAQFHSCFSDIRTVYYFISPMMNCFNLFSLKKNSQIQHLTQSFTLLSVKVFSICSAQYGGTLLQFHHAIDFKGPKYTVD